MEKNHHSKFSLVDRLKSFSFAFNGLKNLWVEEHNFRIHIVSTLVVVIAGFLFKISFVEWVAVILSIGFVLATEIINTTIEKLADFVSPDRNEKIKKIKDISAAGVLIAAFTAFIVGVIIFSPKVFYLIF
ncbi:MAG TPA: diacylglycerol kinase family protein [Draconibacterium sp.]|nr:diacylglycerol kinase family protein [Draconibacterium sp.]